MTDIKKSVEELEKLKKDWVEEPSWDIEETEGFEEYKEELIKYSRIKRAKWYAETCLGVILGKDKTELETTEELINIIYILGTRVKEIKGILKHEQKIDELEERIEELERKRR